MTKLAYLLECLAEECAEVQHIKSKIIRFGMEDRHPDTNIENRHQLVAEMIDVATIMDLLMEEDESIAKLISTLSYDNSEAKRKKIEKFMEYSRTKGTLDKEIR